MKTIRASSLPVGFCRINGEAHPARDEGVPGRSARGKMRDARAAGVDEWADTIRAEEACDDSVSLSSAACLF